MGHFYSEYDVYQHRMRLMKHKQLLIDFICHQHKESHFMHPQRIVEWVLDDINPEVVEFWARVRARLLLHMRNRGKEVPPLFLWIDEIWQMPDPTVRERTTAYRDLRAAVGMRCAVSTDEKLHVAGME